MISTGLLVKYLVIGGGGVATGWGIHQIKESFFSNDKVLEGWADRSGLVCIGYPGVTEGVECKKKEGEIKIKRGDESTFTVKTFSGGRIKAYWADDKSYKKGYKFVIEGEDITTDERAMMLEEFETYEVMYDGTHYKLNRKKKAIEVIGGFLGINGVEECNPTKGGRTTTISCNLDDDKLKAINFEGKEGDITLNGEGDSTIVLNISKDYDEKNTQLPLGYRFELQSNKDIGLGGDKSIKKDTNTEFKIKKTVEGKKISLSLERAWDVTELGKMVGLVCAGGESDECTLGESINLNNADEDSETNKKFTGLTKKSAATEESGEAKAEEKKVKFEKDQGGYNQGFKFFVDGTDDIELQKGTGDSNDLENKKIKAKGSDTNSQVTYEIKKNIDGKWYLTKKTISTTQVPAQAETPDAVSVTDTSTVDGQASATETNTVPEA